MSEELLNARLIRRLVDTYTPVSEDKFWRCKATQGHVVRPLGKPCHDCAVTCGFYTEYSARLSRQPAEIQREASARWHCHNHPDRACRGNIDYLEAARRSASPNGKPICGERR